MKFPKPKRQRDSKYLEWIRKQPCAVHGTTCRAVGGNVEAAHISLFAGEKSAASKVSDYLALPLCRETHNRVGGSPDKLFTLTGEHAERTILRHVMKWLEVENDN